MVKETLPKRPKQTTFVTVTRKPSRRAAMEEYPWPEDDEYPPVTLKRLRSDTIIKIEAYVRGFESRQSEIDALKQQIKTLKHQYA